jgi:phage tail-like protein
MTLTELPPAAAHAPGAGGYPESAYLRYLPSSLQQDPFLRRFLLIFEAVLAPLERLVDTLPLYTEARMTPAEFLPWLAGWVDLVLDAGWPEDRQRALIAHAAEIYRWRGTRRGLRLRLEACTGGRVVIQEYQDGFVLGRESGLGLTTRLGSAPRDPQLFVVTIAVPDPSQVDPQSLRAVIEEDKPAHATYRLQVVRGEP